MIFMFVLLPNVETKRDHATASTGPARRYCPGSTPFRSLCLSYVCLAARLSPKMRSLCGQPAKWLAERRHLRINSVTRRPHSGCRVCIATSGKRMWSLARLQCAPVLRSIGSEVLCAVNRAICLCRFLLQGRFVLELRNKLRGPAVMEKSEHVRPRIVSHRVVSSLCQAYGAQIDICEE